MGVDNPMKASSGWRHWRDRVLLHEDLNFLLTNRVPRAALTHAMGWYARIDSPLLLRLSLTLWRLFDDLDLSDAAPGPYRSLRDVFTRALRPGARPFDPRADILCSPCDAIVGACGPVCGTTAWQAKGFPYRLEDLMGETCARTFADGRFVTLRLTATMYHRFHAPADLRLHRVTYFSGDTWNVNPIALRRVQRLFCRNERALLETELTDGTPMAMVAVAAILVASIRLHPVDVTLHLRYSGPNVIPCGVALQRGQEIGWFEHGSTIIVFVPAGYELAPGVESGVRLRAGQPLWQRVG
ncbi:archaetidylserine decarboxylase [Tepidimonas charontis]|uniref:phosphatidylserine decarboxylase n=1 Tax=Tepidimonas charontis TaxID=2267262 RepID=A0A554XGU3_9BURK|nr:archaetidylserine decarboxylase [Tepidimonas charontis]TSE35041.1 Phosphatidylserine decarboxylase proenzyme [Tepidimonas charontis]